MKHILVVDDDPAIGHMLSVILHKDGHRVLPVSSREAAIDALRTCHFEVVLADSLALCGYVRREWPKAHVIFAARTEETWERWADMVLLKPYHLADLRRAIAAPARPPLRHPARRAAVGVIRPTGVRNPAMARQDCPGRPV